MANNVEVKVPVPSDADSPKFKTSTGSAKYVPEKNLVVWTIKSFPVSILKKKAVLNVTLDCYCSVFTESCCAALCTRGGKSF